MSFPWPLLLLLGADGGAPPPRAEVSGVALRQRVTRPCRGGAAVSPEEITIESAPLGGQPLTVFVGQRPGGAVAARLKTDGQGRFQTRLEPGTYCVVLGDAQPAPDAGAPAPDAGAPAPEPAPNAMSADRNYDAHCLEALAHPAPRCDALWPVPSPEPVELRVVVSSSNQCPQPWARPCWRGPMPP